MVYLTRIVGYAKKAHFKPQRKYLQSGFLDLLRFHVRGGTGGSGLSKYGGIGGRGGDVIVRAKEGITLRDLSKYVQNKELVAGTGFDSTKKGILGIAGEDIIINVPSGVIVYNEQTKTVIGEVNEPDKTLVVALGGVGGCAETNYSGQRGESYHIILDLKLISDIALVGFPNAGKSTLIRSVSNAKPKIAEYPFTTVRPHLGKIIYPDFREILIADLPGLIEGAHKNIGKGHSFLKHLERTKLLLFIIDIQGFRLSPKHCLRNALETVLLLNKEIEFYKPELLSLPAILLLNKMDTKNASKILDNIKPKLENLDNYRSEFPDDICPEQTLKFENILPVSLINKDKDEMKLIKDTLRMNLDKIQELKDLKIEKEMPELKLVRKLKRHMTLHAPVLV
ncbi:GTP-binding protein 10 homolog [Phymastichus coffea]|uniref:GTP-binding protein 10 homolog n=1 Tax=Phymastichus coffea TaxID=108790 RepID=UPI00273AEC70|nr:GTP-binding protein 10 homolog [Phymastichus coffea]